MLYGETGTQLMTGTAGSAATQRLGVSAQRRRRRPAEREHESGGGEGMVGDTGAERGP